MNTYNTPINYVENLNIETCRLIKQTELRNRENYKRLEAILGMLEEEERERSNYQKAISSLSSAASVPMGIIFCSEYPSKSTFDLRSLNQDLL
jgi:hypothetical protein